MPRGLTTTEAPFIEEVRSKGEIYIEQPYEEYSEDNHEAWRLLMERMLPLWRSHANTWFLKGIDSLALDTQRIPRLSDVNKFLQPLTGFKAKPVSGYLPAFLFFDCLKKREFPTTITIRKKELLDYLPEPDIFHDISGHVPMHTDPLFADTLVRFGECAHTAAMIARNEKKELQRARLSSMIKGMARFFWFTIEFGLMKSHEARNPQGVCAYGSGLLSSFGELHYSVESFDVQRYPAQLEWMINQSFEIDHFQPLLFVVEDFAHLFALVDELEAWIKAGKLFNLAPGEPAVSDLDLESFL
jgi:phenylalanine-4-hydroxylase